MHRACMDDNEQLQQLHVYQNEVSGQPQGCNSRSATRDRYNPSNLGIDTEHKEALRRAA